MSKLNINIIKELVTKGELHWTNHIIIRLVQRKITQQDIEKSLKDGEIIEEYEADYPYFSCLVYGMDTKNEVIHVVVGYDNTKLWLITAYYPDNIEWEEDLKTRKGNK